MNLRRYCYLNQPDRCILDGRALSLPSNQPWTHLLRELQCAAWSRLELYREGVLLRLVTPTDLSRRTKRGAPTQLAERVAVLEARVERLESSEDETDDTANPLAQLLELCGSLGVSPVTLLTHLKEQK